MFRCHLSTVAICDGTNYLFILSELSLFFFLLTNGSRVVHSFHVSLIFNCSDRGPWNLAEWDSIINEHLKKFTIFLRNSFYVKIEIMPLKADCNCYVRCAKNRLYALSPHLPSQNNPLPDCLFADMLIIRVFQLWFRGFAALSFSRQMSLLRPFQTAHVSHDKDTALSDWAGSFQR